LDVISPHQVEGAILSLWDKIHIGDQSALAVEPNPLARSSIES